MSTSDANSPITDTEELIFRNNLRKKETQSTNDLIEAKILTNSSNDRSTEPSSRTIRERSRSNKRFLSLTSMTKQDLGKDKQSKITQVASLMHRDKEVYNASAEKANLKIIAKFTPEQAASLEQELSFEQWRVVKRLLIDVAGRDIVGSKNNLRSYLNENNNHKDETGSFTSQLGNKVTFVRITDLETVVQDTVSSLSRVGEIQHVGNKPPDTLQLLYCADKGSSKPKLLFSVLNSKLKHSINRAKLLAIFMVKRTQESVLKR